MNPMATYAEAQGEVTRNYKLMDKALEQAVANAQTWRAAWGFIFCGNGWSPLPVPARFSLRLENGDKWDINVTARANLIERGKPQDGEG